MLNERIMSLNFFKTYFQIVCCFLIIYGKKILRCGKVISTLHPPEERSNNQTSVTDLSSAYVLTERKSFVVITLIIT